MGNRSDHRERTLMLARILEEETDERHPMTMADLAGRLTRQGIAAERKTLYRDMAALRKQGLDVTFRAGSDGGWYVAQRTFSHKELREVIDAVSVYRWLTEEQRETLAEKLATLAPRPQRRSLRRPVAVTRRTAAHPEKLQGAVDRIQGALQGKRAMSYIPVVYDKGKSRTAAGARRVISPKGLMWFGENYRLLAWDHRDKTLVILRPDRMEEVLVTGMPAQGPEADPSLWTKVPFGLEPARRERVRLRCCQSMAGEVLDQFGAEAPLVPEGDNFLLTADVVVGPQFWGWMAAHGDRADVIAPPWTAKLWQDRYKMDHQDLDHSPKAG